MIVIVACVLCSLIGLFCTIRYLYVEYIALPRLMRYAASVPSEAPSLPIKNGYLEYRKNPKLN